MSSVTVISTAEELAALASLESWQAEQKLKARIDHRRRMSDARRAGPDLGIPHPRVLPSGESLNYTGIALALAFLVALALAGFVGLSVWMAASLVGSARDRIGGRK